MFVLGIMTLSAVNSGQSRFVLLLLVLLAVALILVGGIIALLTLLRQRKTYSSHSDSGRLESERN